MHELVAASEDTASRVLPSLPEHEFHPIAVLDIPRQIHTIGNNGTRMYQETSLKRKNCLQGFVPHSLLVYDAHGRLWPRQTVDSTLVFTNGEQKITAGSVHQTENGHEFDGLNPDETFAAVRGLVEIPISPKGNAFTAEILDLDQTDKALAPHDLPPPIQRTVFRTAAGLVSQLLDDGPANIGETVSIGLTGKGLQSVMWLHIDIFQFDPELNARLTKDQILSARDAQTRWDGGLDGEINDFAADTLQRKILPEYWPDAEVHRSPMGPAVYFPNFSPYHMTEEENGRMKFVSRFLQRYCMEAMYEKTTEIFRRHFAHEFTDVVDFVQAAHDTDVDWEKYQELFTLRDEPIITRHEDRVRHALYLQDSKKPIDKRAMRYIPGHTWAMRFFDHGTLFLATPSFYNADCGPIEAHGVGLSRPPDTFYMSPAKARKHEELIYHAANF